MGRPARIVTIKHRRHVRCPSCDELLGTLVGDPVSFILSTSLQQRESGYFAKWRRPPRIDDEQSAQVTRDSTGKVFGHSAVAVSTRLRIKCPRCDEACEVPTT